MFESKGWLRTIGCIVASLGQLASLVPLPQVSAWSELATQIGVALGGVGCVRAAVSGTLFSLDSK